MVKHTLWEGLATSMGTKVSCETWEWTEQSTLEYLPVRPPLHLGKGVTKRNKCGTECLFSSQVGAFNITW